MSDEQQHTDDVGESPDQPPHPGWWPDPLGYADRRWWDGVRWTDHTQGLRRRTHRRRITPLQIAAAAGVVLVLMLMGWTIGAERATMRPSPAAPASEADAYRACEDLTRQLLPAPEDARFPGPGDATIVQRDQEWDVQGYVEVEDAGGATVRTQWICTVSEDRGTWQGGSELLE